MKLNSKGMAISGIIYSILVLFILLIFGLLSLLSNTKYSFDKFKHDLLEKLEAVNFKYGHEDYMLAAGSDIGTSDTIIYSLYKDEYTNIKSVNIVSKNSVPEGAIKVNDLSKTRNNKVRSYLIERPESGYDLYIISDSMIYGNYNSSVFFSGLSSVESYDLSNFDTGTISNMASMFQSNTSLKTVDVSNFNMSNVTTMQNMFFNCVNLESLDVSNWDTSNVTQMNNVFNDCFKLKELDVSNWNVSNVTTMQNMFFNCVNLESLDVSNWNTSKLINAAYLFGSDNSRNMALKEIIGIEKLNTSNVTNMEGMFAFCGNLTSLDLSKWDTSNVTTMAFMFTNAINIIELNLTNWDTSNVTTMGSMFNKMEKVETILGLSEFITSKVENMAYIFNWCRVIPSLDLFYWDVSNVTSLERAFSECPKLVSISFENWNTSNVTNMSYLFSGDNNLETINVSKWDTSNVTNMQNIFAYLYKIPSLNVANWNVSNVVNLHWAFYNNPLITTLDLSGWEIYESTANQGIFFTLKATTVILKDATVANRMGKYLPDRTTTTSGTLVIKGDTTGIDKSAVEALNWQVYDKDGNQL